LNKDIPRNKRNDKVRLQHALVEGGIMLKRRVNANTIAKEVRLHISITIENVFYKILKFTTAWPLVPITQLFTNRGNNVMLFTTDKILFYSGCT